MDEQMEADIRKLLKTFGVKADQAIHEYMEKNRLVKGLTLRIVLEDRTNYGNNPPSPPLWLEVSGEIKTERP